MIKAFIKHQIYDTCIDIFFTKVSKNFNRLTYGESIPRVGEFYRLISHSYGDEHYHNCYVKSIEYQVTDASNYCIVYVTYERSTGNDIIGLSELDSYLDDLEFNDDDIIYDDTSISDLFENDDIEFFESDGVIALNSKYYVFYK